ncbi:MAG: lipoate--protein ligase family protein [Candidatus Omnitrophica bacterium]|nr:lipoate--protein ligase family protein [Candidatus Omnitrophota bacterium]
MILKDISFLHPQHNLLYDDLLLEQAEQGKSGEVLRIWESPHPFIVLGRIRKVEEDLFIDQIVRDGVPVLRRSSGGGTVLQGKGCLNYTFVLSKEKTPALENLHKSYEIILNKIIQVVDCLGIKAAFRPISDLVLLEGEKKFSGNAQRRGRKYILHHGTILYDFFLPSIEKYLKVPFDLPEYRRKRDHKEFVKNIPITSEQFRAAFIDICRVSRVDVQLSQEEQPLLEELVKKRRVIENLIIL